MSKTADVVCTANINTPNVIFISYRTEARVIRQNINPK